MLTRRKPTYYVRLRCCLLPVLSWLVAMIINTRRDYPIPLIYYPGNAIDSIVRRLGGLPQEGPIPDDSVSISDVLDHLDAHNAVIVDARAESDFDRGHIPGAINLPWDAFERKFHAFRAFMMSRSPTRIVVYCSSDACSDSSSVRKALYMLGYRNTGVLKGGWSLWTELLLPIDRDIPR